MKKFSEKANERLIRNQDLFDRTMKILVLRNGTKVYRRKRRRKEKVVDHYLRKYHLIGTSVNRFWLLYGRNMLTGKAF